MKKKLVKHGAKVALILDTKILKALNIDENATLELSIENNKLIVQGIPKKSTKKQRESTQEIADRLIRKYDAVFRKLAKT